MLICYRSRDSLVTQVRVSILRMFDPITELYFTSHDKSNGFDSETNRFELNRYSLLPVNISTSCESALITTFVESEGIQLDNTRHFIHLNYFDLRFQDDRQGIELDTYHQAFLLLWRSNPDVFPILDTYFKCSVIVKISGEAIS